MRIICLISSASILLAACVHTPIQAVSIGCEANEPLRAARSRELIEIAKTDQADRNGPADKIDWVNVNPRDLQRRIRVATIFAEGCFSTASDYAAAATVYQHGKTADHYYQTFIWANRAVDLGDKSQKWWAAAAIDRYLVATGHRQLFGTQMSRSENEPWCLQQVEPSFPEKKRIEYVKYSVTDQVRNTLQGIGANQPTDNVKDCGALLPTPRGSVPGFW